jgi:diaminopimelate decarboxylase
MAEKKIPLSREELEAVTERFPTPFHIYDEKGIRENAQRLKAAFAWNPGFKEYFAVKAAPNPYLMKILKAEGFGSDCSSMGELLLSEKVGVVGEDIIFTSNDTPAYEYKKAIDLGAIINLDDISHIDYLETRGRLRKETSSSGIRRMQNMALRANSFLRVTGFFATRV